LSVVSTLSFLQLSVELFSHIVHWPKRGIWKRGNQTRKESARQQLMMEENGEFFQVRRMG